MFNIETRAWWVADSGQLFVRTRHEQLKCQLTCPAELTEFRRGAANAGTAHRSGFHWLICNHMHDPCLTSHDPFGAAASERVPWFRLICINVVRKKGEQYNSTRLLAMTTSFLYLISQLYLSPSKPNENLL